MGSIFLTINFLKLIFVPHTSSMGVSQVLRNTVGCVCVTNCPEKKHYECSMLLALQGVGEGVNFSEKRVK